MRDPQLTLDELKDALNAAAAGLAGATRAARALQAYIDRPPPPPDPPPGPPPDPPPPPPWRPMHQRPARPGVYRIQVRLENHGVIPALGRWTGTCWTDCLDEESVLAWAYLGDQVRSQVTEYRP